MNDALQAAIKEAYATAPSNIAYLETLEISHPSVPTPVYIVRDRVGHNLTLEDTSVKAFEPCPFRLSLPASGDNGLQELLLSIENVDRRIGDFLEAAKESIEPITVKYRPYLSTDPTTPQLNPPLVLSLTDVTVNQVEASGRATFADIINKKFPTALYTRARFPSLAN